MDSLDLNLHSAILISLAQSYADPDHSEEPLGIIRKLPPPKAPSNNSKETVEREQENPPSIPLEEPIAVTNPQAQHVIAYAAYVSQAAINQVTLLPTAVNRLCELLEDLVFWHIQLNLSTENAREWPLVDEVSYRLVTAGLEIRSVLDPPECDRITSALGLLIQQLTQEISRSTPLRLFTHHLPVLSGMRRAINDTRFTCCLSFFERLFPSISNSALIVISAHLSEQITSVIENGLESHSALHFRQIERIRARYELLEQPLTPYMIVRAGLQQCRNTLAQCLACPSIPSTSEASGTVSTDPNWDRLTRFVVANKGLGLNSHPVQNANTTSTTIFLEYCAIYQSQLSDEEPDEYLIEIICEALKLATISSLALGTVDDDSLNQLLELHTDAAVVIHPTIQSIATQSLVILARNFPLLVAKIAETLRNYVTSAFPPPDPEILQIDDDKPTQTVSAAANGLAVCIELTQSPDFTKTTMFALVNHINTTATVGQDERPNSDELETNDRHSIYMIAQLMSLSPETQQIISINALHTLAHLVQANTDTELNSSIVSTLILRLQGASSQLEAAILSSIASLALDINKHCFGDVITAFTTVNMNLNTDYSALISEEVLQMGIHRAQTKLATSLAEEEVLSELYLMELLALFVEKGKLIQSNPSGLPSFQQLVNVLGVLIPPIGGLLRVESIYNPRSTTSIKLSELFRNFWYVCVLFGFLSPPAMHRTTDENLATPPEWLTASLRQIATKSPTLTHLTSIDYVTTQLDYNPILKFPETVPTMTPSKVNRQGHSSTPSPYQVATEQAKKLELATLIPTHSGQIRSLNFVQTIFLLTVARLEIFRAEDCRAWTILEYLGHVSPDELDPHNLFGCLVTISEKVLSTFITSFQQHVIRHRVVPHIHEQIPEVLKFTCHHSGRIRTIALRYCQDMIIAFPTLMCNFGTILTMLELLTLLRQACQGEYEEEYSPKHTFRSESANLTITLTDDYPTRQQILSDSNKAVRHWLSLAITRAPLEMKSLFLRYLDGISSPSMVASVGHAEMGKSIALELAKALPSSSPLTYLPSWGNWSADLSNDLARSFSSRMYYNGQAMHLSSLSDEQFQTSTKNIKQELLRVSKLITTGGKRITIPQLSVILYGAGSHVLASPEPDLEILARIVSVPIKTFTPLSMSLGLEVWTWLIDVKPEVEIKLMTEVMAMWTWTLRRRKGLFSNVLDPINPLNQSIQFTSTDREEMQHHHNSVKRMLKPHSILVDFISSRFQAARYTSPTVVLATMKLLKKSLAKVQLWSRHPLSRELRTRLIIFGFSICQGSRMEDNVEHLLRTLCYEAAFDWFSLPSSFGFGANRLQHELELRLLEELLKMVKFDQPVNSYHTSSLGSNRNSHWLPGRTSLSAAAILHADRNHLLQLFLEHEIIRLMVWHNPISDAKKGKDFEASVAKSTTEVKWKRMAQVAWSINPQLTIRLAERFKHTTVEHEASLLVKKNPQQARNISEALSYFVGAGFGQFDPTIIPHLHHILYWKKTPVMTALTYFLPQYDNDPILLQYAMRVLEEHPVDVTFFYIPQVVQALRTDTLGYVERFICETAKVSQLFCHQIIWNMKANTHKGDDGVEPDSMKPTLDRIMASIVNSLSGEAKEFYEIEFKFFDEVTGISKTLKDYLKKDKAEKKAKIKEELAKIEVIKGVYLPSNPDGTVIDIDRESGRPLQSHAKTPFMATFKVHREKKIHLEDEIDATGEGVDVKQGVEIWQAAIFKVGDDCRQDALALQLIAIHKTIYEAMCLDLHLVPYRVTATAPGCGVIDVIPDATSRDEMGRAKINDLNSFFIGKFGPVESVAYQKARMNFIRSMAAYSVMCYLIQIKDRHNGNIMIDGEGHITHVDFGFLFDIGPGGIKFEPNSFKLTGEMIVLMGGQNSSGFRFFQELVVKAFLIARPYAKEIVTCVKLMSETQLPSFKGEGTITRLMDRFKPHLSERDAALYMQGVIGNAKQNGLTLLYDEFQWVTNEIPYTQRDWIARAN